MSRLLTSISLPGCRKGWGLMDWGELSPEEMIKQYRHHAAHLREQVEAIEGAADSDFKIDVVRGPAVQHHVRSLQAGRVA